MFRRIFNSISKLNKTVLIILVIILFFLVYSFSFKVFRKWISSSPKTDIVNIDTRGEKNRVQQELERKEIEDRKKSVLLRFNESKKMFISSGNIEDIKVEGEMMDNFNRITISFVKLRGIDGKFEPDNRGKTNTGIEFETDFNYFVVKDRDKTEYYKIPVAVKSDFQSMYNRMIFTSVDYIVNKKDLGKIRVCKGNDEKGIMPWKKDDLIHKILYKREVGKIQPEKDFQKSKKNFTIKIKKSNRDIIIQTMGKDFIKVTSGDNIAYYEVYKDLYEYLDTEIFGD
ncbi:hypothetical protein [Peptostreptococcus canis]|uniref:Uncharacterized protein n=1 Tax=Peptostreptococcus canis TaxID=1159213 RepID=A0ABR6TIS5_9FIRM|nr:hypothetical protein [Peptostreptococcus canis]MBC2575138.1 hypothetical protein [Peptostreptococcus canis]MBP1997688.1 hypothetical protein [Peptostreptococcus canis]